MRARQGLVAIVGLCVSLACAGLAQGAGEPAYGCEGIHRGEAEVNPNPRGRPPIEIGDSTVILPIPNLSAVGYSVNARGCRGFKESIDVAAKLRAKHRLPHLVLINDYGNGGVNPDLIQEALDLLGRSRVLGLVTEYNADTGHPPAPDTDVLFRARKQYPHRILVLDWVKYSRGHHKAEPKTGAWFLPDLFHPTYTGAEKYAQFLARALPFSASGRFP
jgi:hypothetical protein